ncbi:MAG: dimethyl sulfoxide reductase anchor subunit [Verrucomicrobia bacterium]|nr:dimethyl sulfoxide reductase anchor subunit [Verrucomicrobiota bacterium]
MPESHRTLIEELIVEQRRLTAVETFARAHERHEVTTPRYRDLIPLTTPRPGEQYAFEVDLDRCSGCKACVTACHSLNGLDDGETWRDVGALFGETIVPDARGGNRVEPLQQTVTTACHHCLEPACASGCPVLAYDKDPATGIVRHLDDQCIGCSYCVMMCPYEVPKYSAKRGIVRKCDLCHGRLAAGEAPACVQACPNEAIRITLVAKVERENELRVERGRDVRILNSQLQSLSTPIWLPDSPSPKITLPTTRYVTAKPNALLRAADHERPKPQPPHWPLIVMLVLTQAGLGGTLFNSIAALTGKPISNFFAWISLALLAAGLAASVAHLGQPMKAWRVWLGWRASWLSREAIALNAFAGLTALGCFFRWPKPLAALALVFGVAAIGAQAMVYADTKRHFWKLRRTAPRFFGTTAMLGTALAFAFQPSPVLAAALIAITMTKLAVEVSVLKHADSDANIWTQLRRTAVLQRGVLRSVLATRLLLALAGGVLLPFIAIVNNTTPTLAFVTTTLCLFGEIAERQLFFTSVAPDKMPI